VSAEQATLFAQGAQRPETELALKANRRSIVQCARLQSNLDLVSIFNPRNR
jgi:hypothetical protein